MMPSDEKFVNKFMRTTDKFQKVFGPADQGDMASPVVHKHDGFEDSSDEQLSHFAQETDSDGHHYAERKAEKDADER